MENVKVKEENGCFVLRADSKKYGKNEILVQSPLICDIERYCKKNGVFAGFTPVPKNISNLRDIPNKELYGYYRMYFKNGYWQGRWFNEKNETMQLAEQNLLNEIVSNIRNRWTYGCSYGMIEDIKKNVGIETINVCPNIYWSTTKYNSNAIITIDTTYMNDDYPVRIYIYKEKDVN